MEIILTLPDELAGQISAQGQDPARAALEALALEGYRSERLSAAEVRRMLGFQTGMQVHAFLKEHRVYLQYGEADLEQDLKEILTRNGRRRDV